MSSGIALLPIGPGPRTHVVEQRPRTAPSSGVANLGRSPQPFVRPQLPRINIDPHKNPGSSRRTSGNLALQARDSLAVRKRTLSTGAMSARAARHMARKAAAENQAKLESTTKDISPAGSLHDRPMSQSTDTHPNRPSSRSPTHSHSRRRSCSPPTPSSSSSTPITPAHNTESAAPSSYHTRAQTHVPQNSHGTTTSAYPASTSQSSRSTTPVSEARSRTPSPLPAAKTASSPVSPRAPLLDLDPDDVNARLRLLVNNSYFLPPAHVKPELTPIYLSPTTVKNNSSRPLSPGAFKEFFRVGKRKDKKAAPETNNMTRRDISQPSASAPVTARDDYFDLQVSETPSRNRVVVVRETVDDLPIPAPPRAPYRSSSFPTRSRNDRRESIVDTTFIDPTTQYDIPPPTHYPSYQKLGIDVAGINGDAQLDQFAPPGSPWSPSPSASRTMDSQERIWRRAILEQAVDLSLSSSDVQPGADHEDPQDTATLEMTFAPRPSISTDREPSSPKSSVRSKKGWWSSKKMEKVEKEKESGREKDEGTKSISQSSDKSHGVLEILRDLDPPSQSTPKHNIGQAILPNLAEEILELERNLDMERGPIPLALKLPPSFPFPHSSVSAPPTPIYYGDRSSPVHMTPLSPRPLRRPTEPRPPAPDVREDFLPGHSTIKKSLSSPLLSDMHETAVDVDEPHDGTPDASHEKAESIVSFEGGGGAPSLVLHNPHGAPSNPTESFLTASQSEYHDEMYDAVMEAEDDEHHRFGMYDVERWSMSRQSSHIDGGGRPSFDSFSPHQQHYLPPPRLSSTFGFRHSNLSLVGMGSGNARHIEVDISGDPMEHLSMLEQRSESPGGESQSGYVSAMDRTFYSEDTLSMTPSSPSQSFLSTRTRLPSLRSHNQDDMESTVDAGMPVAGAVSGEERGEEEGGDVTVAPISFFDSVQHQSYMDSARGDHDDASTSDSESEPDILIDESEHDVDVEAHEPPKPVTTAESYQEFPNSLGNTQVIGRTSLNTTRPIAPAFSTRFPNASQPALPEHKRPLVNVPRPSTGGGRLLAQLKSNKGAFPIRKKGINGSEMVVAGGAGAGIGPSTYATSISSSDGSSTHESMLERTTMRSLPTPSPQGMASAKKDEELKKLDGLVMQHMEAEKDRLRRIASAVREKGGVDKAPR